MEIGAAFFLGLLGSLHCAGMCGPLALALPVVGRGPAAFFLSRLTYNFGRLATYAMIGLVLGLAGRTMALAGFQRWVSLAAGVLILTSAFATSQFFGGTPVIKTVAWLKAGLARWWQKRTFGSLFVLGLLNGLLPCGLVYVAGAAATATGSLAGGAEFMLIFGLGTLPMMLGISLAGRSIQAATRFRLYKLIPAGLVLVGGLLILRGLSLGIPYLSPDLASADPKHICPACH